MSFRKRTLAKISQKLHLWLGVIFTPLMIMLAISGIGLNHPDWVRTLSLPLTVVPDNYHYKNWNRGLVEAIIPDAQGGYFATGKEGVWQFNGDGARQLLNPLQDSAWKQMGYSLYLDQETNHLISGARDNLYSFSLDSNEWRAIDGAEGERFVSILLSPQGLIAVSRKGLYLLSYVDSGYRLKHLPIMLADNGEKSPLFRFIFQLHSGELLGKFGVLLMDMVAGLLVFLSVTALYMFLFPRLVRRKWLGRERRINGGRRFRWMFRHHNRWGLIVSLVLLISGLTGMVMRPPGLILISSASSPVKLTDLHGSPLPYIIEKGLWDQEQQELMLLTSGGMYRGDPVAGETFSYAPVPAPVHAMGATLFQRVGERYVVGSFSGVYSWEADSGKVSSIALDTGRSLMMPKALLEADNKLFFFDFYTGLNRNGEINIRFPDMPDSVNETATVSLWHMLFELHNMRIFQAFIGPFYLLLVALSGLALVIIAVTGVHGYLKKSGRRRVVR